MDPKTLMSFAAWELTCHIMYILNLKWNEIWTQGHKDTSIFCETCTETCLEIGKPLKYLRDRSKLPQTIPEIKNFCYILEQMIDKIMSQAWGLTQTEKRKLIKLYSEQGMFTKIFIEYKKMEINQHPK